MTPPNLPNPFPGLRPFEPDEDHLFFGREAETDELVRRLRTHRFLSVIGTSGCGKSSLVRSGLIPSLESGLLVKAGSSWRIAILRPGEDPIGHLAEALGASHVLGAPFAELATTKEVVIEATLRRSTLGLVEAIRQAHLPAGDNVLVLVDQFEELFRFRKRQVTTSRDDAVAFVKLLLEASSGPDLPIYIVLTMRSDFIGDCMDFPRLPEALNDSQYLVPRMTRDELRSAIAGPVAVAGAEIKPRLVLRLLNDIGDDQDELPLLQHVLMRTWDHWAERQQPKTPIDLGDYEAVGTLADALSQHAEEAYRDTGPGTEPLTTARIFQALTDTFSDPRGVRRPTSVADLAAICEVPEAEIIRIVEIFRRPGRSFLMPPASVPLTSSTMIDLSHESLMRCWKRLMQWAHEERQAAGMYVRLAREASFYEEGKAGLWADPQLELGLRWRSESHPTAAWARRYDETYERAIQFLDLSQQERDRQRAERHAFRMRRLVLAWGTAGAMLVMSIVMFFFYLSARRQSQLAEANLSTARNAVRQLLVSIDPDPATIGADVPQVQELRRNLLEQARALYGDFIVKNPGNDALASDVAFAHFRLGDMNRMLEDRVTAVTEYLQAVAQYDRLAKAHPDRPYYRAELARTYNWLGFTLVAMPGKRDEAQLAFDSALELQTSLLAAAPANPDYQLELARTHMNRGILRGSTAALGEPAFAQAEADFREAIRLFTPLAESKPDAQTPQSQPGHESVQNLARALNNLASLVSLDENRLREAASLTDGAVQLDEGLLARQPDKREYKLELAQFSNNLANLQLLLPNFTAAETASRRAIELLDDLMRAVPSLGIEHADGHDLRARILQAEGSPEAVTEYRESLSRFSELAEDVNVVRIPGFHQRFRDLLRNLARLCREQPDLAEAHRLLGDAADRYAALGERAVAAGQADGAHSVLDTLSSLSSVFAKLDERDRAAVAAPLARLQKVLRDRTEEARSR